MLAVLAEVLACEGAWLFAATDDSELEVRAALGAPAVASILRHASASAGALGIALDAGGVAMGRQGADDAVSLACARAGLTTQLAMALAHEGRQAWAILLATGGALALSEAEHALLSHLASVFSQALQRLTRGQALADRVRNEGAVNAVLRSISSAPNVHEAVLATMEAVRSAFDFVYAASFVLSEPHADGKPRLLPLGDSGRAPADFRTLTMCRTFADDEQSGAGRAVRSGDLVPFEELSPDTLGERAQTAANAGFIAGVCVPLSVHGRVLSVLELWSDQGERSHAQQDEGLRRAAFEASSVLERLAERDAFATSLRSLAVELLRISRVLRSSTSEQTISATELRVAIDFVGGILETLRSASNNALRNAEAVIRQAERAESSSARGHATVSRTSESMAQLRDQTREIAERILALEDQTSKVSVIIATVNEIAAQSKILALNAAIEAARAGEHGLGFSVVASEIRSLAEQSRAATAQVRTILARIEGDTDAVASAAAAGAEKTSLGLKMVEESGARIVELAQSMSESSASARKIADGARQQNTGIERVVEAIELISDTTLANSQRAVESERLAEELAALAQRVTALSATLGAVRASSAPPEADGAGAR